MVLTSRAVCRLPDDGRRCFHYDVTSDTPTPAPDDAVFGRGARLFLGAVGSIFAILAVAIPMVIIAASATSDPTTGPPPTVDQGLPGEQVALDNGCMACHTTDGNDLVGPTWLGLAGSERELESGETVIADDAYLESSIVDPSSQVVAGFNPLMPQTYRDQLSDQDIADLIEFINSLA